MFNLLPDNAAVVAVAVAPAAAAVSGRGSRAGSY